MKLWNQYRDHIAGVGALTLGSAAGVLVPALLTPLLMTLYSAEQFGSFGMAASILAVISQIICLKYDIPLSLGSTKGGELFVLCLMATGAVALLVVGGSVFTVLLGSISVSQAMLLAAGSFFMGINLSLASLAISHKRYLAAGIGAALRGITAAVIPLCMIRTDGLLWGYVASYLISGLYLAFALQKHIWGAVIDLPKLKEAAVAHLDYLRFSSIGGLSVSLIAAVTNYYLAKAAGQEALGAYTVINRLLVSPVLLFGGCVGQVYGRAAGELHPDIAATRQLTNKYRNALAMVAVCVGVAGGGALAFVSYYLDGQWGQLVPLLPPVLLLLGVRLVVVPLSSLLLVWGRQLWTMCWQVVMLALWVVVGGLWLFRGSSPTGILWAQCVVLSLCYGWGYRELMGLLKPG